jgi:hypothetical protein
VSLEYGQIRKGLSISFFNITQEKAMKFHHTIIQRNALGVPINAVPVYFRIHRHPQH